MPPPSIRYSASLNLSKQALAIALKDAALKGASWTSSRSAESYFDTFDWRLFKKGLLLCGKGSLCELSDRKECAKLNAGRVKGGIPRFAKELPHGQMRDALVSAAGPRALLQVCSVRCLCSASSVLNSDGKTVAKASHMDMSLDEPGASPFASILEIIPVKGYGDEFRRIVDALDDEGLSRVDGSLCPMSLAVRASGRMPDDYSSKFQSPLRKGMDCRTAASSILASLMHTMERNINGVLKDIDAEFLHDFRVATRRIRAALSQFKGAFPERHSLRFRKDFRLIGRLTGALRDIDVMLLSQEEYELMLPEELRPAFHEFLAPLLKRRKAEYSKLASELSRPAYSKTFKRWKSFLSESRSLAITEPSSAPVEILAERFMSKRLSKISRMAAHIDEDSSDADFHTIRIEFKKLRYLLEFFGPLASSDIEGCLQRLKQIQDALGEMNDLAVQRSMFMDCLIRMPQGRSTNLQSAALGCLFAKISDRNTELKRGALKFLSKFLSGRIPSSLKDAFSAKDIRKGSEPQ